MITGKQLVEKLYSEGWELEQREYGLLSKMKGFISKRNLEKYYRYKGELNRLKNEKSKIQGELSNLDERAPKNMKLERAKNERAGKSYKFNKKNIVSNSTNEDSEIASKHHQVIDLIKNNNQTDPESAQKIIKDLKKKGVKFTTKDPKSSYYAPEIDVINLKKQS